jgi:hypothetical protein
MAHLPGRSLIVATYALLALAACPDSRVAGPDAEAVAPGLDAAAASEDAAAPFADAAVAEDASAAAVAVAGKCVSWESLPTCSHGGMVYAVGRMKGTANAALGRTTAASRARRALFSSKISGSIDVKDVEVPAVASCGEEFLALARAPASEVQQPGLPACPAAALAIIEVPAVADCPTWTSRVSWIEGGSLFAVGAVSGMRMPSLAQSAAAGRARSELQSLLRFEADLTPNGFITHRQGTIGEAEVQESATCGNTTYVEVSAKAP